MTGFIHLSFLPPQKIRQFQIISQDRIIQTQVQSFSLCPFQTMHQS